MAKTPNKRKSQGNEVQTPKSKSPKQKNVAKPAAANGVTKAKNKKAPNPKVHLIPDNLYKSLNRRQRRRVAHKLMRALKDQGTEDPSTVDPNDASVKEIIDKILKEEKQPAKPTEKEVKVKTPKNKKVKTPKKTPTKSD